MPLAFSFRFLTALQWSPGISRLAMSKFPFQKMPCPALLITTGTGINATNPAGAPSGNRSRKGFAFQPDNIHFPTNDLMLFFHCLADRHKDSIAFSFSLCLRQIYPSSAVKAMRMPL
jgi:hypothetical protein